MGLARLVCGSMEGIVLRVRLISGDSMDVTYEERDAGSEDEVIDHVVSTLAEAFGVLRCRHGDRLVRAVRKRCCCGGSRASRRGPVSVRRSFQPELFYLVPNQRIPVRAVGCDSVRQVRVDLSVT